MARGGQPKDRDAGPERRCIVTGEGQPKYGLIRFVVGPDGQIVPDVLEKLPGRGIWVKSDRSALDQAVKKRLFARAARQAVTVPDSLADEVERQITQRVIDLIAMARKAGRAVAGYEKVKSWLDTGEAHVLIQATDGSERGKSKLKAPDGEDSFVGELSAQELGLAFGREHVIHGALATGGLTRRVVEEAARLSGLRRTNGGNDASGKDLKTR
ncbi:RNA-binding protein [Psychromarinibacter halotolerans]|uniref:RNA-binding protein n=1 Tax=Psychromarinibacter halotolerans TaxID=1775175 RepID=A0ABV7GNY2_9RHOB|nr:RNA-binding protein [Psychromarinibacter halotolerans]MDF0595833.1 RNA-binding protein [Psychromarinibacter halotolerans]